MGRKSLPNDPLEKFAVGPPYDRPKTSGDANDSTWWAPNIWPDEPKDFKEAVESYYMAMLKISQVLMKLLSVALDMPKDFVGTRFNLGAHSLKLNFYPSVQQPVKPGQERFPLHTDLPPFTLLTLDRRCKDSGLQAMDRKGRWMYVNALEGSYCFVKYWRCDGEVDQREMGSDPPSCATVSATAEDESFTKAVHHDPANALEVPLAVERPLDHPHLFHGVPITKLYVFDFDSTLFRSPLPNAHLWAPEVLGTLISDCGWFVEPRTLRDPFIPASPDPSWWDLDVVAQVRKAMKEAREDGNAIVTLLTGRRHDLFGDRINDICNAFDRADPLKFDLLFFREGFDPNSPLFHPTTLDFKFAVLYRLLAAFPNLTTVLLWDDRKRHLDLFEKELVSLKNSGRLADYKLTHVIHDPTMEKQIVPELERKLVQDLVDRCNAKIIAAREREEKKSGDANPEESFSLNSTQKKRASVSQRITRPNSVPSLAVVSETHICCEPESLDNVSSMLSFSSQESVSLPNLSVVAKPTEPELRHEKSNLSRLRRSSASLFRSLIELTDIVYFTGIFLDDASRDVLLSRVPAPERWAVRADHVTICMGQAGKELIHPLGGIGGVIKLKVVAKGLLTGKVLAVQVELAEPPQSLVDEDENDEVEEKQNGSALPRISTNAIAHITIAVAVGAHGRQSNDIKDWTRVDKPFILTGVVGERRLVGLKGRGQGGNTKPKEVSVGGLVMKHHPALKGKDIGKAVGLVEKWMSKTFMDNLAQNAAAIELFITNLKVINGRVEDE
ncbi:hypothetical protein BC829DRAFT_485782 [Chytridium lagenaria]|nr:hypothetical protein BC829DRAFT_485782 [Chytridium lagenaria]